MVAVEPMPLTCIRTKLGGWLQVGFRACSACRRTTLRGSSHHASHVVQLCATAVQHISLHLARLASSKTSACFELLSNINMHGRGVTSSGSLPRTPPAS